MIRELSLLLWLLGQPTPSTQPPETTTVQKEYINALEDANSKTEDTSAAYTYIIAKELVLNTPDSILCSLSEPQIYSALSMIHSTNAVVDRMQNHDGLNWAPKLNFDGPFHPDSLAENISRQVVRQGNPELFLIFYPKDQKDDPLRVELYKRINEIRDTLVDSLPEQGNEDEKPQLFQLPVVDRNGQTMLNIPYSRKYENAVAAVALFKLMAAGDIFSLKITDEKYFKAYCILRYIADTQTVLDKKIVAWILQKIDASKLYKASLDGTERLIFERSEIDSIVELLSKDQSFQKLKNGKSMRYRGKTYELDSVSVFCGYYNSFEIKNLYPVPTDPIFLSFEYGGAADILQAYLSGIETALRDGKQRKTANELLALLILASEKGIPLCSEMLNDYYESITGSLLVKSGNPTMGIVKYSSKNPNPSTRCSQINGTTIAYNAYCTNAYIIFDYQVGDSATIALYLSPSSFNLPYRSQFKIGCNDSQAQGIINIIKRWEDAYKNNPSDTNLQKQLVRALYDDFNSLDGTSLDHSANVDPLFLKTTSAINKAEATNLKNDKINQPGKQPTQPKTQTTTEQNF